MFCVFFFSSFFFILTPTVIITVLFASFSSSPPSSDADPSLPLSLLRSAGSSRQAHRLHGDGDVGVRHLDPARQPRLPHPVLPRGVQEGEEGGRGLGHGGGEHPAVAPLGGDHGPGERSERVSGMCRLGCGGVLEGWMDGKKKNENCRNCLRCELGNYSVITAPPPVNLSV